MSMRILALAFLSACMAAPVAAQTVDIAPLDEALTFARTGPSEGTGEGARLLAVMSYKNGDVEAVDLTAWAEGGDAIDLVNREGYDRVREAIMLRSARFTFDADSLVAPVSLRAAHIAVGTNYRAHAEEANVKGGPFLFPKLVAPTGPRASIPFGDGLLDYEAELCLVAMRPLGLKEKAAGGLILCNDVTDRAALLRHVDPDRPESGDGFPEGKSAPGYLPVGDLFVVPRDLDAFARTLSLTLEVNGSARQSARVDLWIWDLDRILTEARAARGRTWPYWEGTARLPFDGDGALPERAMILAGTPAGTVFNGFDWSDYAGGLWRWTLSGFKGPASRAVIERYIARMKKAKAFLQPGDIVTIETEKLGRLENVVR
jgi:2-keto-4-pentenoate hydratase/2-oxohepta-3-ene-1,7-dioic acid hydratase in catechol pathway